MQFGKLTTALILLTALFITSCKSNKIVSETVSVRKTDTVFLRSVEHKHDTIVEYHKTTIVLSPDSTRVLYRHDSNSVRLVTVFKYDTATKIVEVTDTNTNIIESNKQPKSVEKIRGWVLVCSGLLLIAFFGFVEYSRRT